MEQCLRKIKRYFGFVESVVFVYFGENAPELCPCCDHAKAFYQVQEENYN